MRFFVSRGLPEVRSSRDLTLAWALVLALAGMVAGILLQDRADACGHWFT